MSTAASYSVHEDTSDMPPLESQPFYSGPPDTQHHSAEEKKLERGSPRLREAAINVDSCIESIRQKWNGIVLEFNDNELTARLEDVTNPDNPKEIVVLSIEEIESRDRALIQVGAMFWWHIGYRRGPKYPQERFSKIRFRRLLKWTENEIKEAEKLADEYARFFNPDQVYST